MHDGAIKMFQLAGPVAWSSGVLHALLWSRVDWLVLALAIAPLGKCCACCVGWWDPRSWAGENISGIPADLVAGLRMLPLHRCCGLARFWAIKKADPKISLKTSIRIRSCLKINTYAARDATSHFIDSFSQ